ncbi:hypothetical protein I5D23_12215, partial [Staphylococcus aureus]|nr:hypothetical protein [Staphylococcus aureus]
MTNITKEVFDNLEQEIDVFAKNKTLGSSEAKPYLDEYHSKIIDYFKQVNDITGNIDFESSTLNWTNSMRIDIVN